MKHVDKILLLVLMCTTLCTYSQQSYYSYYNGQKQFYTLDNTQKFILTKASSSQQLDGIIKSTRTIDFKTMAQTSDISGKPLFNTKGTDKTSWAVIKQNNGVIPITTDNPEILYEAPYFKTTRNESIGISHLFYVKLKNASESKTLVDYASKNNVSIISRDKYMPLWYTLACSKGSAGNALEMANKFHESSLFESAEPDIIMDHRLTSCPSTDPLLTAQWHLDAINWCDAKAITNGSPSIIVAVIDTGVDLTHEDLSVNMTTTGYDARDNTYPSHIITSETNYYHATGVAGIIGAAYNNNVGVSGIAPGIKMMSVSLNLSGSPSGPQQIANAINYAWTNGAAVMNCSWKATPSNYIDNAINAATGAGRSGNGTIMVFASGNDNSALAYPSSLDNVVAVGAIDQSSLRASFSNFGTGLDVVAPGVAIETTDVTGSLGKNATNYMSDFEGTSAAAPMVSGIFALMLSVNPSLKLAEARRLLESTTSKPHGGNIGTPSGPIDQYQYGNNPNQPNGTWNNELGYGLVDARKAVIAATGTVIGAASLCASATYSIAQSVPGYTLTWSTSNPSHVSIDANGLAQRVGNFNGYEFIIATITNASFSSSSSIRVMIGTGEVTSIVVDDINAYQTGPLHYTLAVTLSPATLPWTPTAITWKVDGKNATSSGSNPWTFYPTFTNASCQNGTTNHTVTVNLNGVCGSVFTNTVPFNFACYQGSGGGGGGGQLRVSSYPNPATDELKIAVVPKIRSSNTEEDTIAITDKIMVSAVILVTESNTTVRSASSNGNDDIIFDTKDLPEGIYYLKINHGNETTTERIVIKH